MDQSHAASVGGNARAAPTRTLLPAPAGLKLCRPLSPPGRPERALPLAFGTSLTATLPNQFVPRGLDYLG
jgi:hypothetical protein